jgi:hypothetical protein
MPRTTRFTREEINEILEQSDNAVERAIIRLFTMQNEDEQRYATTNTHNDRGFGAADARAGTRFARWLLGMDNKNVKRYQPKRLSNYKANRIFGRYCKGDESVMDRARRIALKHSRQLMEYANAKLDEADKVNTCYDEISVTPAEKKPLKPMQSDVWYQNAAPKTKAPKGPPPGSWAATARMMAQGDDSGFDWDRWKDEMKERDM